MGRQMVELFDHTGDDMEVFVKGLKEEDLLDEEGDGFRLGTRESDRLGGSLEFIRCLQEFFGDSTAFVKCAKASYQEDKSPCDEFDFKIPPNPVTIVIVHSIVFTHSSPDRVRKFTQSLRKEHPTVTRVVHVLDITSGRVTNICYSHLGDSVLVFFDEMEALGIMGCSVAGSASLIEEMLGTRVASSELEKIGVAKSPLETNNARRLESMGFYAPPPPKKKVKTDK